jgi:hypothetical protein
MTMDKFKDKVVFERKTVTYIGLVQVVCPVRFAIPGKPK